MSPERQVRLRGGPPMIAVVTRIGDCDGRVGAQEYRATVVRASADWDLRDRR